MTAELVYLPAPRALRRAGCLSAAVLYGALVLALAVVVFGSFFLNFSRIFADVSQRALAALLPQQMALLQPAHSPEERAAFSNAFSTLAARIAHAPSDPHGQQALAVFNQLLVAARDRAITRAESAAFVSNVLVLTTLPLSSPQVAP